MCRHLATHHTHKTPHAPCTQPCELGKEHCACGPPPPHPQTPPPPPYLPRFSTLTSSRRQQPAESASSTGKSPTKHPPQLAA